MTHEGLIELLKDNPELLGPLLTLAGLEAPAHDAVSPAPESLGNARPLELRVDGTFRFTRGGEPVLAVVVEVQLGVDEHKRVTWPAYATSGGLQFGCDTLIVVLTNNRQVAAWAKQPMRFALGLGAFRAIVLGPDEIPEVQDVELATRAPYLAALSAVVHGHDADAHKAAALAETALIGAVRAALSPERYKQYYYVISAALSEAARQVFDMFSEKFAKRINDEMAADFLRRGKTRGLEEGLAAGRAEGRERGLAEGLVQGKAEGLAQGKAEGLVQGILAVLSARGVALSEAQHATVMRTTDLDQLSRWLQRAATVSTADALFG